MACDSYCLELCCGLFITVIVNSCSVEQIWARHTECSGNIHIITLIVLREQNQLLTSAMTIACLPVGTWYISYDSSFSNFSSTMIPSKNFLHYSSLISIYSMISHQSFDTWHWITTGIISKSSVVLQAWVKHWLSFGGVQLLRTVRVTCFVQYTPLVME